MSNGKAKTTPSIIDEVVKLKRERVKNFGVSREVRSPRTNTSLGISGGKVNSAGSTAFLPTGGGVMIGPIAFAEQAQSTGGGTIDVGVSGTYTGRFIAMGQGGVADNLDAILNATNDGQLLFLQAVVTTPITLKDANGTGTVWATSTSYSVGDVRVVSSIRYVCYVAHTSGSSTKPSVGADWEDKWYKGNIHIKNNADYTIDGTETVLLQYDGINTVWTLVSSSGGADNLGNHTATQSLVMNDNNVTGINTVAFTDIGGQISVADATAGFNFVTTSARPFRFTPNATNILDITDAGLIFLTSSKSFAMNSGSITSVSAISMDNSADIDLNTGNVLDVREIRLTDDSSRSKIMFNAAGSGDTFIANPAGGDEDRIDFFNNNFNSIVMFYDTSHSRAQVGIPSGASPTQVFALNDNWELWKPQSAPADSQLDNGDGLIYFDTTPDPAVLKIKKKDASGSVTTVSLEDSGGSGANQQLSNLTGTIAVNSSLYPSSTLSKDLGSSSKKWRYIYATQLVGAAVTATSLGMSGDIDMNSNDIGEVGLFTNTGSGTFSWSGGGSFQVDSNICALYSPNIYIGQSGDAIGFFGHSSVGKQTIPSSATLSQVVTALRNLGLGS